MSSESRIGLPPDGRDDMLTRLLRRLYAAPADPAYWDGLQARVMARIAAESEAWWHPFGAWVRTGLVAAGLAVIAAGMSVARARDDVAHVAYQQVIETPRTLGMQIVTETTGLPAREATLRYLIEP